MLHLQSFNLEHDYFTCMHEESKRTVSVCHLFILFDHFVSIFVRVVLNIKGAMTSTMIYLMLKSIYPG